jgi:hypothetical protein
MKKYKTNESTSRQNPKKTKTNNQQKIRKRKPCANRTQGYKMTINDDKKNLTRKSNRLPQIG